MKLTADQREAINDILIDAFQTPKFIIRTNDIASMIELNPEWSFKQGPEAFNITIGTEEVFKAYHKREHKKDARLMRDIMNADHIVKLIEGIAKS